jgi:hypothetical protein
MLSHSRCIVMLVSLAALAGMRAFADGAVVDKIYDPYVEELEREIEYRVIVQNDASETLDDLQIHQLAVGASWSDRWSSELYVIGARTNVDSLSVEAYELETKWQLTEQGEYWADWGLLFEIETERSTDASELSTTLLVAREWGRWVTTANVGLIYEWGGAVSEWEAALSLQGRYRLTRGFEPALEFYSGQDTLALGPVFVGDIRAGGRKKLRWEVGVIFGLDGDSPDRTFRGLLELEF